MGLNLTMAENSSSSFFLSFFLVAEGAIVVRVAALKRLWLPLLSVSLFFFFFFLQNAPDRKTCGWALPPCIDGLFQDQIGVCEASDVNSVSRDCEQCQNERRSPVVTPRTCPVDFLSLMTREVRAGVGFRMGMRLRLTCHAEPSPPTTIKADAQKENNNTSDCGWLQLRGLLLASSSNRIRVIISWRFFKILEQATITAHRQCGVARTGFGQSRQRSRPQRRAGAWCQLGVSAGINGSGFFTPSQVQDPQSHTSEIGWDLMATSTTRRDSPCLKVLR